MKNLDYLIEYSKVNSIPLMCTIELTKKCNFNCKHCYQCYKNQSELSTDDIKSIIDILYQEGCLLITLTGGEIFLRKDFIEIYKYIKSKGMIITIFSNISLLTDDILNLFKLYPPFKISISLYGTNNIEYNEFTETNNSYSKVIKNLQKLKSNNINFDLRTIATTYTYNALKLGLFHKIAENFNVDFRYDYFVMNKLNGSREESQGRLSNEEILSLEINDTTRLNTWKKMCSNYINDSKNISQFYCPGGDYSIQIDAFGNASICMIDNIKYNILNLEFKDLWSKLKSRHSELISFSNQHTCNTCDKKSLCRWCPIQTKLDVGSYIKPILNMCEITNLRLDYFNKINKEGDCI